MSKAGPCTKSLHFLNTLVKQEEESVFGISYILYIQFSWAGSSCMNENGYPASTNNNQHRRRIKTEEEAKVFAAVWGTELIKFLAKLSTYFPPGLFEE